MLCSVMLIIVFHTYFIRSNTDIEQLLEGPILNRRFCNSRPNSFYCDPENLLDDSQKKVITFYFQKMSENNKCYCGKCGEERILNDIRRQLVIGVLFIASDAYIPKDETKSSFVNTIRKRWKLGVCPDNDIVIMMMKEHYEISIGEKVLRHFDAYNVLCANYLRTLPMKSLQMHSVYLNFAEIIYDIDARIADCSDDTKSKFVRNIVIIILLIVLSIILLPIIIFMVKKVRKRRQEKLELMSKVKNKKSKGQTRIITPKDETQRQMLENELKQWTRRNNVEKAKILSSNQGMMFPYAFAPQLVIANSGSVQGSVQGSTQGSVQDSVQESVVTTVPGPGSFQNQPQFVFHPYTMQFPIRQQSHAHPYPIPHNLPPSTPIEQHLEPLPIYHAQPYVDPIKVQPTTPKQAPHLTITNKTPQKINKTPQKIDKTPQKIDKTPQKIDKTPKKIDKTPQKMDKTLQTTDKKIYTIRTKDIGVIPSKNFPPSRSDR